jgi:wobble nucleotide-excising tRNase
MKKIVHIKNLGRYESFISSSGKWNGNLDKINAVYADNSSGKTTLTQIFKSLKSDNNVVNRRKTFGSTEEIDILLIDDDNEQLKFKSEKWNKHIKDIEIFDSFFIESNVYLITLDNYNRQNRGGAFFEIIVGDEGIELTNQIIELRKERKRLSQNRRNYKSARKKSDNEEKKRQLQDRINLALSRSKEIVNEIKITDKKLAKVAEEFGKTYLDKINTYLRYFNPTIQLTKLNKVGTRLVYYLKIKNFDVRSDSESASLKHTLSEGDKSSLALSFFLARLSLLEDLEKKIIIFDDPISSFDHARRSVTINQLYNFSKKSKQFILLSHDINFVKDFTNKVGNCLNLKISNNGNSSVIVHHNIELETMTGIFKDLTVMHNFIENGISSEFDKREVIRCIRPAIEGLFRIKFYRNFKENEWLGDIIKAIRDSEKEGSFYHLTPILEELSDINGYSKSYHHSNPNYLEIPINDEELRNYVNRTLELIVKI